MSDSKMILVSNHLLQYPKIKFPAEAVIRINLAYVKSAFALEALLATFPNDVFLDFPEGRQKPPVPVIKYSEMIEVARECKNVKYIAVSNIEGGNIAGIFASSMPEGIQFIPKIETARGIVNIHGILDQAKSKYIMLDTEDLFMDVRGDVKKYEHLINYLEAACEGIDVTILKIQGVVFAPWEN